MSTSFAHACPKLPRLSLLACAAAFMPAAFADILPPNDLHLEDNLEMDANMTREEFDSIVDGVVEAYQPLAALHGGELKAYKGWDESTVNASAQRMGRKWLINMYGGLARRPEVTKDGFAMVVCHELGHHLAGFPFKGVLIGGWAANEGQSDYFATQACARRIWRNQPVVNATFRTEVEGYEKRLCDDTWTEQADRDLCYRVTTAGQSLADLLAALKDSDRPTYETPDTNEVRATFGSHPAAQCRLDTYLAGSLCTVAFKDEVIPGKGIFPFGDGQETEAMKYSCGSTALVALSRRPRCWFAPKVR